MIICAFKVFSRIAGKTLRVWRKNSTSLRLCIVRVVRVYLYSQPSLCRRFKRRIYKYFFFSRVYKQTHRFYTAAAFQTSADIFPPMLFYTLYSSTNNIIVLLHYSWYSLINILVGVQCIYTRICIEFSSGLRIGVPYLPMYTQIFCLWHIACI